MTIIRAFIAIEIPMLIRANLESTIQRFKSQKVQAVRWVAVNNIHLTLKFLGDTSPDDLRKLTNILQNQKSSQKPFAIQVSDMGAFPNQQRPRIIWVGLQAPSALNELQSNIEKAASLIGIPPEDREFSPHLTLGRVRNEASPSDLQNLRAALNSIQVGALGEFTVNQYTLFRSDLRPQGPIYTVLQQFGLDAEKPLR
jgi:2'-5' RNA ligase